MFLKDLDKFKIKPLQVGDDVYLIKRVSYQVEKMTILEVGVGNVPKVRIGWNRQYTYVVNVNKNEIVSETGTFKHKQQMRKWYYVWEPHLAELKKLFLASKKKEEKRVQYNYKFEMPEYKPPEGLDDW